MAFIAQVFSLFRRLSDVNWDSITSSAPFLKYDSSSDKIVGAPVPAPASPLTLTSHDATETPLTLVGDAGQSASFFKINFANGASRFAVDLYQTSIASDVVLGGYTYICRNQAAFTDSGLTFRAGYPVTWTNGSAVFDSQARTRLSETSAGLLRVQNVSQTTTSDGGIVQQGVYVDTANAESATTLGDVVRKIKVFDAAGNPMGFVAVYDDIV